MLSKSCEYALRAVIFLSSRSIDESMVSADELANDIQAPKPFISKILQQLSKNDIISSKKGPNGGFYMTKKNKMSRMSEIIIAIDGRKLYDNCVLGLKKCSDVRPCPLHNDYKCIKQDIIKMIDKYKIEELEEKMLVENSFLKL